MSSRRGAIAGAMPLQPECLPCILTMVAGVAFRAIPDEAERGAFLAEVTSMAAFSGDARGRSSPETVLAVWQELVRRSGDPDPLRDVKERQNAEALALLPAARERVAASADPLAAAVRLAIGGNALDAMVGVSADPGRTFLEETLAQALDAGDYTECRRRLFAARRVAYVTDNCGEIVFDRLLLEVLRGLHPLGPDLEVTVVTRALPALNDATLADARAVGLDRVASLVANGIDVPLPGTALGLVADQVGRLLREADVVVVKGVANYELLGGEPSLEARGSFLLQGKCDPICRATSSARGALILRNV